MKDASGVKTYDASRYQVQEEPDGASFVSLLLCSFGMFTRNKLMIWVAIFFILSTMCRKKYSSPSTQYLINAVMIVFGLVTSYIIQPPTS